MAPSASSSENLHPILQIDSKAPTRIDLAGGTLDIWPIFLLLDQALTLNLGINLHAETQLKVFPKSDRSPSGLVLKSLDQNSSEFLSWEQVAEWNSPPPWIELHLKLFRYFKQSSDIEFRSWLESLRIEIGTRARSPAGAGLGGSSTLSISLIGALHSFFRPGIPVTPDTRERFVEIARDIETTVIQVPAGLQDYYGAAFGGLQALHWKPVRAERESLSVSDPSLFQSRILLFYSGQSRNSGINNWALYKGFIDRDTQVRKLFQEILQSTHSLRAALRANDWEATTAAIDREWQARRQLAQGITTPEIDASLDAARKLGSPSGKICGAGGGGCFFVTLPDSDPERATKVIEAIQSLGPKNLPFEVSPQGVTVQKQESRLG
jgi:D-glycero-alpha-D-manno-heptose-7-phosphate kinase